MWELEWQKRQKQFIQEGLLVAYDFLRVKGHGYFEGVELTRTNEDTTKDPKVSLLKSYQEKIIPASEEKVFSRYKMGCTRQVCIVMQEYGAGLYQDKT